MSKRHMGSSIDDFLKQEGIFEKAQTQAVKEVVAWQLAEAMREELVTAVSEYTAGILLSGQWDPKGA